MSVVCYLKVLNGSGVWNLEQVRIQESQHISPVFNLYLYRHRLSTIRICRQQSASCVVQISLESECNVGAKCDRDTFCLSWGLNLGPLARQSRPLPIELKGSPTSQSCGCIIKYSHKHNFRLKLDYSLFYVSQTHTLYKHILSTLIRFSFYNCQLIY